MKNSSLESTAGEDLPLHGGAYSIKKSCSVRSIKIDDSVFHKLIDKCLKRLILDIEVTDFEFKWVLTFRKQKSFGFQ